MTDHKVVGREEWQAARDELLQREKEHTRIGDELARQRRELPWVSSANTDFNYDFGASYTEEQVRSWSLDEGALPPIVAQNAAAAGTTIPGYLSESPAMSAFTLQDGAVCQTYATAGRGVEFLMPYYPVLDRAPKGRDEGDAFQTWIRRHDEYA